MALTTNSNHTVLRGGGQGGHLYTGVEPIVVNNQEYKISANTAALGVESPLYFSVDTPTQTVISFSGDGQPYSAGENISVENHIISGKDWTPELDEKLDITAYEQGDTAFYSAGPNIDITDHVISGKDWNPEINNASSYALSEAINQMQGYPSGVDNITPDIVTSYISGGLLHISAKDWTDEISGASAMATAWTDSQGYLTAEVEYSAGANIDITDHIVSGKDWSDDITAASANALNEAINQITAVELANSALTAQTAINANHAASSDSATYDSLGRKIVDTYLTAHQQLPDWTPTIQNASGNAYNSAVNWVVDQHYLTGEVEYSAGDNIDITNHFVSGKDWSSEISDASANAVNEAINQITAVDYATSSNVANTALTANYVADGWEYNASNEITGYSGSAFHAESPSEGKIYTGISPIVVDNSTTTGTISAQTARLGVQSPLYFVEDTSASTVIGISGLPEVEGVMYESALNFGDGYITGYNGSALSSERAGYAVSSTSANGAVSSQTAAIVTGGWETANGKITGYNGTAFNAGGSNPQVPVSGVSGISITKPNDTIFIGVSGQYLPYTNITTGDSGTTVYNVASGIRVTSTSGWVEIYNQNKENENEAHLQVGQNYADGHSFWGEFDGAGGGFIQLNWNSGAVGPNSHSSYSDGTTAAMSLGLGSLIYRSATHNITATGEGGDGENKVWQLGSERLRFWNQWGTASFGPRGMEVFDNAGNSWYTKASDSRAHFIVSGSAGNGARGAVELAPQYINFYNDDWSLNQTLNTSDISALKALLNHVQSASANW